MKKRYGSLAVIAVVCAMLPFYVLHCWLEGTRADWTGFGSALREEFALAFRR